MNIVIFTSKNHIYANYILNIILADPNFKNNKVTIIEQDWIIVNKGKLAGLLIYLKRAGLLYVFANFLKQYLFVAISRVYGVLKKKTSIYYPYSPGPTCNIEKVQMNGMQKSKNLIFLNRLAPDLIISIFSKEILRKEILELAKTACVNLHPSLLPQYRGVSPTFWCLAKNEKFGGITLHHMDKKIDKGEIIFQKKISLETVKTEHGFYLRCAKHGAGLILKYVSGLGLAPSHNNDNEKNNVRQESYHSLPSKSAVRAFKNNGYHFFRLRDFFLETDL